MEANYFTILYWFCHTSTWIHHHGCTRVPHPEPLSHIPPRTILLGHPSAPAPSILYPASNLDWRFISYMILYTFQCHSPKSFHPCPLPQSPKDCSRHLCLFCCLAYRWPAACQGSLSLTISQSLPKVMFIVSVMPSSHLILWRPLLLPSIFPSIRDFANESSVHIRSPKYWSFSNLLDPKLPVLLSIS